MAIFIINIYLTMGEPDGLDTYFYESGIIASEQNWNKGETIGEYRVYHRNGNIWEIYPKKGGLIQYFYPNGNIYKEIPYVDKKYHGEARWYDDNGSLIATQHYLNGVKHGNGKRYTPQGNVDFEMPYNESRKLFYKTFDHCIMLYQLSALTNELIGDPLISFISLPDQSGQQSRLQGYLTSAPDYFQYILSNIMFAPHINLSAWKTKSNITVKFDNDEPKPLRCKFYNYELTKLLQNFPDEIYRENNILPKNDLDTLGLYAFVNEFNQIGG
ncbi:hypothetical protein GQ589_08580 [Gilliamella sp. Pas-s27]|nr:hypothetical protein [Gilliamella sp. Pas-s27]